MGRAGHVQDSPLLGHVDLLTPEHRIDPGPQAGFLGQLQQESQGFIGDAVFRVIEVDADGLGGQTLAAFGVVREQLAEVQVADNQVMGFEGLPRGALSEWRDGCCHRRNPFDVSLYFYRGQRRPT